MTFYLRGKQRLEKGCKRSTSSTSGGPLHKFTGSIFAPMIIWDWRSTLRCGKRWCGRSQNSTRVGGTASRLLSGQTEGWRKLEEEFAGFAGTEAALFFGSGYAANMGLLSALVGRDDVVYSDTLNHASLIDGMRLSGARKVIYPHLNLDALENSLRQDAGAPWRRIIVTESVFSMNGDVAPLKEMACSGGEVRCRDDRRRSPRYRRAG